jgi:Phosphopantetheine attachment site
VLQMTARIRRQMEVELAVRVVFEAPTIAGLAQEVERARAQGSPARAPVLQHRSLAAANADEDAVLTQLDNLSADEARRIVRNILNEKTGRVAHEPGHKS